MKTKSKNSKIFCNAKNGSIMAYSLIILFVMVTMAVSMAKITVLERKDASGATASVQAFETADTGTQLATKELMENPSKKINDVLVFPSCSGSGDVVGTDSAGGKYTLSFYDGAATPQKLGCNSQVQNVSHIRSIGEYGKAIRALMVDITIPMAPCSDLTFANCGQFCSYNGDNYGTVKIGGLCWLSENLRTTRKPDGTSLVEGTEMFSANPVGIAAPLGRFYTWATAMNISTSYNTSAFDYSTLGYAATGQSGMKIQGLCPTGWHLPSDFKGITDADDFRALSLAYGGDSAAGAALKRYEIGYWNSNTTNLPNAFATNTSGFNGIGVGGYDCNTATAPGCSYSGGGGTTFVQDFFWSSYQNDATTSIYRSLTDGSAQFNASTNDYKKSGLSVRCVLN